MAFKEKNDSANSGIPIQFRLIRSSEMDKLNGENDLERYDLER